MAKAKAKKDKQEGMELQSNYDKENGRKQPAVRMRYNFPSFDDDQTLAPKTMGGSSVLTGVLKVQELSAEGAASASAANESTMLGAAGLAGGAAATGAEHGAASSVNAAGQMTHDHDGNPITEMAAM